MNNNKKVLLLGSSSEYEILAKSAKEMGFYVIICDGFENGYARQYADKCYTIPVNEIDTIAKICEEEKVDRVLGSFSDYLFECMVRVSHAANLPTYISIDKLEAFRSKEKMAEMFNVLGIDYPKTQVITNESYKSVTKHMHFPMIIKPVSGWGSHGIKIVHNYSDIHNYLYDLPEASRVLLQEYNEHQAYNFGTWIINGKVHPNYIERREVSLNGTISDVPTLKNMYSVNIDENLGLWNALTETAQKIADYSGIENGPLNLQAWADKNNHIQMCEVAARCFGYDQRLIHQLTGLQSSELLLINAFAPEDLADYVQENYNVRQDYLSTIYVLMKDEILADDSAFEELLDTPEVLYKKQFVHPGESTTTRHESYHSVVILHADDMETLKNITNNFIENAVLYNNDRQNIIIK